MYGFIKNFYACICNFIERAPRFRGQQKDGNKDNEQFEGDDKQSVQMECSTGFDTSAGFRGRGIGFRGGRGQRAGGSFDDSNRFGENVNGGRGRGFRPRSTGSGRGRGRSRGVLVVCHVKVVMMTRRMRIK